ncbi:hypothetical protein JIX56_44295 [Streptomyces sp. CA-210063]|uniref:hypothetical protein n=1 Tax=Streptomyces sp. CA-210063 TaxID=2801029 RepID=UPI00214B0C5C|nr:hypothetical protein [Streptomyces sp. CA-210063]UUU36285.1 hypothetical protein JIX56_44295 [Streptomyces sp. CA-210063]
MFVEDRPVVHGEPEPAHPAGADEVLARRGGAQTGVDLEGGDLVGGQVAHPRAEPGELAGAAVLTSQQIPVCGPEADLHTVRVAARYARQSRDGRGKPGQRTNPRRVLDLDGVAERGAKAIEW